MRRDLGIRLDAEEAARVHAGELVDKRIAELERQMGNLGAAVGRAGATGSASPGKTSPSPSPKVLPPGLATPPRSPGGSAKAVPLSPEDVGGDGGLATAEKLEAKVSELRGALRNLEASVQTALADQKEELVGAMTSQLEELTAATGRIEQLERDDDLKDEVAALKTVCDTLSEDVGRLKLAPAHGENARDSRKGHKDLERRIVDRKNFKEKMVKIDGNGGEEEARALTFNLKMFLSDDKRTWSFWLPSRTAKRRWTTMRSRRCSALGSRISRI